MESLTEIQDTGTVYFDTNRYICLACNNPNITIGAASHTERPLQQNKFWPKSYKLKWCGVYGNITECKFHKE